MHRLLRTALARSAALLLAACAAPSDDTDTAPHTDDDDETPTEAGAAVDCNSQLSDDLAGAVRALFDIEPEEPISEARMALMTSIKLRDASSIAGIACLPNVKSLLVEGAVELDLTPLRGMALTDVWLARLTAPSGLEALATLPLQKLELIEVELLAQLTEQQNPTFANTLTTLRIEQSSLADLSWLAGFGSLQELSIPDNDVSDLEPLRAVSSLVHLDAARNAIEELSALTDLPRLEVIHVERNQIATLEGLTSAALRELWASRNAISALDGFASASLEVLDLDYNALDTAPELEAFPQLKSLLLRGNQLSAFTAPSEHGLELLWLTGNPLDSAVGLSPLQALTNLALGETPLSELSPLTELTALERLDLHDTPVSDLSPLSSHSNIIELELSQTAVRSLDPIEAWTQTPRECGALLLEGVQLDSPDVALAFCRSGWRVMGAVDCTSETCGNPI